MTIGERIKIRRLELGLTQSELAHRLGLKSKVSISTVENDKEDLTTDRIRKFAEALETTPAKLMGWEKDTPSFNYDNRSNKAIPHLPSIVDYHINNSKNPEFVNTGNPGSAKTQVITSYAAVISSLLGNEQIIRLMLAAQHATPDQIEMAINLLNYKKDNE